MRLREGEEGTGRGGSFLSSGALTSRVRKPCAVTWEVFASIVSFSPRGAALAEVYKEEAPQPAILPSPCDGPPT